MNIEFLDLKKRYIEEKHELFKCFKKVLSKGNLILTKEVSEFEEAICEYTKAKYCLGLNSGTDALMMALWSVGVKKGDEVITTATSFVATSNSIRHLGAIPVFVDVQEDLNIDPNKIEKAITKKTKVIMPVHWTGRVCEMDKIMKVAKKKNIIVIEDAAQAMGAYFKNKHAGTFGKVSAFSTHPFKNLNAVGDGGFIVTNNKKIFDKIKIFRNHGIKNSDDVEMVGVNSRLDSLHAEILKFRLKKLKNIILRKRRNINLYQKFIDHKNLKIFKENKNIKSSHSMFVTLSQRRDDLKKFLEKSGIQSRIYYKKPLHLIKANKDLGYKRGDLPNTEKFANLVLSFPYHQHLKNYQIKFVCKKINDFYNKK